ncbi:MAG: hypothetical protein Q9221_000266 [Calogaya cf. arnoldii]
MSASQAPKKGLDNAASIHAFLSKISPAVKHPPSSSKPEDFVEKASKLNLSNERNDDATNANANGVAVGATKSTPMGSFASPELEPLNTVPTEKVPEGVSLNTPPDHSNLKNPLVAGVQAQGSPQLSGVRAPPPTPDTSNVAIGRLLMDVLEDIPKDRMLSLGDSIHAPKNYSKLRYNRSNAASQSQNQFFSPVPQSSRPREDASFTRMSFKAAETPSPPLFSLPGPENKPVTDLASKLQRQPAAVMPSENSRLENGSKSYTSAASNTPPPPPCLKPAIAEEVQASKVRTPDVPDRPLDANVMGTLDTNVKGLGDAGTPLQPRYARANPFSVENIPQPVKEVHRPNEKEAIRGLAVPEVLAGVGAGGVVGLGTPRGPPTSVGGLLTPASITSPQSVKAASVTAPSMAGKAVGGEDLEQALFFKAWPKVEQRGTRTAARVRKIMLTGIPPGATPSLVASFVFGGPLERIHVGDSSALVTFLRGDDADKYYEATGNGLDYEKDGKKYVIITETTTEVNPISGILREYIEKEFTRCVRAVGVDAEWTAVALQEVAARKGRKVEKIVDSLNASKASVLEVPK